MKSFLGQSRMLLWLCEVSNTKSHGIISWYNTERHKNSSSMLGYVLPFLGVVVSMYSSTVSLPTVDAVVPLKRIV